MGLNITVMSYLGHMDFGLVADRDQMPDVWLLMDWLRRGARGAHALGAGEGRRCAARPPPAAGEPRPDAQRGEAVTA